MFVSRSSELRSQVQPLTEALGYDLVRREIADSTEVVFEEETLSEVSIYLQSNGRSRFE